MTLLIILITAIVSIQAFSNPNLMSKLIFNAYAIKNRNEWYRFFSSGLLHADWIHLLVNMFVLYSFGGVVEKYYGFYFGMYSKIYFIALYVSSIFASSVFSYYKYQKASWYNSLGASGAVAAVMFAYVLFQPLQLIYLYGIIPAPGIIMGVLYLIYSQYASRKSNDNINHDAHFYGALYGVAFTLVFKPEIAKHFISQLSSGF